ncbi:cytochrome aa3 quinol oxidase subunit II [Salinicoccus albus]|uniref:cytochrome aa3 quinol oxidase subunit II n=1 Tax=Salinicoccus albus TaxID=418756 RepID=UPI0003753EA9|nr:cytochrome aa3 quinol oxidase subunit II [Salinicoccus albus]
MKGKKVSLHKKWFTLALFVFTSFLAGCEQIAVLDPIGPVGESQKNLILYAVIFMLGIIVVVYTIFAVVVFKYRANNPNRKESDYKPEQHGNALIETIWITIPVLIVIALSIPTINTIFALEEPPESSNDKEPIVVYATAADWKWIFSYPEQDIETVNYLHIPTDRAVEFRLSSTEAMASFWVPQLGGQKYAMAGMENTLYLQADEEGVYKGRNANFTGEGFAAQTFNVHTQSEDEFNEWAENVQNEAPELTQSEYDEIIAPGLTDEMAYSGTHLDFVDHGSNDGRDYAVERHAEKYGEEIHLENEPGFAPDEINEEQKEGSE